jgi:transcriptional regulator with XRE-family HTH domain
MKEENTMDGYHYTECGLDNVWLENGFERRDFGGYGSAVAVHDEKGLWTVLGRSIAHQDSRMVGQELRFLRTVLGWTQAELGARLGYKDGQIVAKWEKASHGIVPMNADTFVRAAFRESIGEAASVTLVNTRLMEVGEAPYRDGRRVLSEDSSGHWAPTEAPAEMEFA